MWIVGDSFLQQLTRNFIQMRLQLWIPRNFETRITALGEGNSGVNSNAIGRIINSLVRTFNNNRDVIPKWIVIVPEDDLINSINHSEFGVSIAYGLIIDHIMKQINSMIWSIIANLPHKAVKYDRPHEEDYFNFFHTIWYFTKYGKGVTVSMFFCIQEIKP